MKQLERSNVQQFTCPLVLNTSVCFSEPQMKGNTDSKHLYQT